MMRPMADCCRCGIGDWAGLRRALGLTQHNMAEVLGMSIATIQRLESPSLTHHCPQRSALLLLRIWVREPSIEERILLAGYVLPATLQ